MDIEAEMDTPRVLKAIAEAIGFLIDETYLYFEPTGIKAHAIDSSHVAMLLAYLPKALFSTYKCTEEFKVGINVADFNKILKRAKGTDSISLMMDKKDKNTLLIKMKSEKSKRTFKLKSKEIQGYDAKEEGLLESFETTLKDKFTAAITMEGSVLDEIVKDALIITDLMKINVRAAEKILQFSAYDDAGEVDIELDLAGKGLLDSSVKNDAEGIYSLNFLENIIKIQSVADNFQISLGSNIPMKIVGKIGELPTDSKGGVTEAQGAITYLLAPRVEDSGEEEFGDEETANTEFTENESTASEGAGDDAGESEG